MSCRRWSPWFLSSPCRSAGDSGQPLLIASAVFLFRGRGRIDMRRLRSKRADGELLTGLVQERIPVVKARRVLPGDLLDLIIAEFGIGEVADERRRCRRPLRV